MVCAEGSIYLNEEVYVSDPCYPVGTWCMQLLKGVKPGKYECFIDYNEEGRTTYLLVVHEDYKGLFPSDKSCDHGVVAVDSGSLGVYDKDYYEKYHFTDSNVQDNAETNEWFNRQFDIRYNNGVEAAILDEKCIITFSGYGDGLYPLRVDTDPEGKIVSMLISFNE